MMEMMNRLKVALSRHLETDGTLAIAINKGQFQLQSHVFKEGEITPDITPVTEWMTSDQMLRHLETSEGRVTE